MQNNISDVFSVNPLPSEKRGTSAASKNVIPVKGFDDPKSEEVESEVKSTATISVAEMVAKAVEETPEHVHDGSSLAMRKKRGGHTVPEVDQIELGDDFDEELSQEIEGLAQELGDEAEGELDLASELLSDDEPQTSPEEYDPEEIKRQRQKAREETRSLQTSRRKPVDKLAKLSGKSAPRAKEKRLDEVSSKPKEAKPITWQTVPATSLVACVLGTQLEGDLRKLSFLAEDEELVSERGFLSIESEDGNMSVVYVSESLQGTEILLARGTERRVVRVPFPIIQMLKPLNDHVAMFLEDDLEGLI